MSNIDKQALRDIASAAKSTPLWHAVGVFGEVVGPDKPEWKPVHDFCKTFTAERVLALLDELEAVNRLNIQLQQKCEIDPRTHQIIDLEERIAELEAREVKLPEMKMLRDYLADVTMREREDILVGVRLEFFRAIEEAGVKVSAACKGEAS